MRDEGGAGTTKSENRKRAGARGLFVLIGNFYEGAR